MAYARLTCGGKVVEIKRTLSSPISVAVNGKDRTLRINSNEVIARVDIDGDFSKVSGITAEEAVRFKAWADNQQKQINEAFLRNAKNGLYGGSPVIKASKGKDEEYSKQEHYIDCKSGEFNGIIEGAIFVCAKHTELSANKQSTQEIKYFTNTQDKRASQVLKEINEAMISLINKGDVKGKDKISFDELCDLFRENRVLSKMFTRNFQDRNKKIINHDALYGTLRDGKPIRKIVFDMCEIPKCKKITIDVLIPESKKLTMGAQIPDDKTITADEQ